MRRVINMKHGRFGTLHVLGLAGVGKDRGALWKCFCIRCGKTYDIKGGRLRQGGTKTCRCMRYMNQSEHPLRLRHGFAKKTNGKETPEYKAYSMAKYRCEPMAHCHANYFDRGIRFRFDSFEQFFAELGVRPSGRHTVDRKNNDGNYEPGNVRWATRKQQANNTRKQRGRVTISEAI